MSRICRYHYGIKYDEDFDASRHLLQDKVWHDLECTWKAANQMKWYLSRVCSPPTRHSSPVTDDDPGR